MQSRKGTEKLKLALGTVQFGLSYGIANKQGQVGLHEARAIVEHAAANGINTLDTAVAYGGSEQNLGKIGIAGWSVVSKLPAVPDACLDIAGWAEESVRGSLQRLKVEKLYALLLHRPSQLLERNGDRIYHSIQKLKEDGFVKKIGVSIYSPIEIDALSKRYRFDIVQGPFNILDRRLIRTGWLSRFADSNTEFHARSVFLQGLLLMKAHTRPKKFDRWSQLWSIWQDWLEETGLTPLQVCLRYAVSFPEIDKVIVGVDSLKQLQDVLLAVEGSIPGVPDELDTEDPDLLHPSNWSVL